MTLSRDDMPFAVRLHEAALIVNRHRERIANQGRRLVSRNFGSPDEKQYRRAFRGSVVYARLMTLPVINAGGR
jgi:acetyl-CoA carboxylase alpha subunit